MSFASNQSFIGIILGLLFLAERFINSGPRIFIFLTVWVVILQLLTFLSILLSTSTYKKLLMTSWTMGWYITIVFWLYIFPIIKDTVPIPLSSHIISHGLIHLQIVIIFVDTELKIQYKDYLYPLLFNFIYLFGVVVPLKVFYQIIIYPKLFEELGPTVGYIVAAFGLSWVFFVAGKVLHERKKKVN